MQNPPKKWEKKQFLPCFVFFKNFFLTDLFDLAPPKIYSRPPPVGSEFSNVKKEIRDFHTLLIIFKCIFVFKFFFFFFFKGIVPEACAAFPAGVRWSGWKWSWRGAGVRCWCGVTR